MLWRQKACSFWSTRLDRHILCKRWPDLLRQVSVEDNTRPKTETGGMERLPVVSSLPSWTLHTVSVFRVCIVHWYPAFNDQCCQFLVKLDSASSIWVYHKSKSSIQRSLSRFNITLQCFQFFCCFASHMDGMMSGFTPRVFVAVRLPMDTALSQGMISFWCVVILT